MTLRAPKATTARCSPDTESRCTRPLRAKASSVSGSTPLWSPAPMARTSAAWRGGSAPAAAARRSRPASSQASGEGRSRRTGGARARASQARPRARAAAARSRPPGLGAPGGASRRTAAITSSPTARGKAVCGAETSSSRPAESRRRNLTRSSALWGTDSIRPWIEASPLGGAGGGRPAWRPPAATPATRKARGAVSGENARRIEARAVITPAGATGARATPAANEHAATGMARRRIIQDLSGPRYENSREY
jgi:hypothetical protein